jgi:Xaa-Pro aminopeptidase
MPSEWYWASEQDGAWFGEVRWADRPVQEAVKSVRSIVGASGVLGVSGLHDLISLTDVEYLREHLDGVEVVDATPIMQRIRSIKSSEELALLRESAGIVERAFGVLGTEFRPGRSELDLAFSVEQAAKAEGAKDVLILTSAGPYLRPPSDVVISADDFQMFSIELSSPMGYWTETGAMLASAVADSDSELLRVSEAAFDEAASMLRPGVRCEAVARKVEEVVTAGGYSLGIWGGHGIGLEIPEYPSLVGSAEDLIEENMVFGFHPHVIDPATNHSVYISDTMVVTPQGGVSLAEGTPRLLQA